MSKPQERRRLLLVDRRTQLKYVIMVLGTVIGVNLIVGFCVYVSVWNSLNGEYSDIAIAQKMRIAERMSAYQAARTGQQLPDSQPSIDAEAELLSDHLLTQLKESFHKAELKLIPIVFLLLLVVIFEGIAISNRIVGPIFHAEKSLQRLSEGDFTNKTHFRRKDEFKGLQDHLNIAAEKLNHRIVTLKKQLGKIADSASDLKSSLGRYNPEMGTQVSVQAEQILKRVAECNVVIEKFTTQSEPESETKEV